MSQDPAQMYLHSLSMGTDMIQNMLSTVAAKLGKVFLAVDGGSGPGSYLPHLLTLLAPGGKLISLDPSQEMLDAVANRFNPAKLKQVQLVQAKIEEMHHFAKDADIVLCASSLQFTDVSLAVDAVYETLADHGVFLFSMPMGLAGALQESPQGVYQRFQELFHANLRAAVAKEAASFPQEDVARPRKDRNLLQFLNPCLDRGFEVIGSPSDPLVFKALQTVPASKLATHLSVPWRAERFVPGLEHRIQELCIRRAIEKTITEMKLDKHFPFPRTVSYVALKKSLAGARPSEAVRH
ncbi:Ubiquinone/menaquinone biosynthesis C-methyltransferase UbiE [Candidatus Bilamarchaeum dharawalense]|uniref:Ubiquinone/menaquinone biosynthesis C-methyltransferase UbiE n=1 Tax=Candidatus Bilamarchaeum dharawalense TaxID=2885759 RepID=A0A5E4LXC2_9ARCH|nr:Ubiquinone/menaquinone biosynthesis C-methyltransferase UbiE [Candidatus Bilamarchaeum dharawalense]